MTMEQSLQEKLFAAREMNHYHAPYELEYGFYGAVQRGDVEYLQDQLSTPFYEIQGLGKLSQNEIRNILYHLIISIAMISRYCIEGGMEPEAAYSLSDSYIQQGDACKTKEELGELHRRMTLDFALRMQKLRKEGVYSRHVIVCIDYIYQHLHDKISLKDLAGETGLNPDYLSRLFRQETGMGVLQYVRDKKLEQAEYMMKHTKASITQITNDLNFSSESYFIQVFKQKYHMTPKKFQDCYFRKNLQYDLHRK